MTPVHHSFTYPLFMVLMDIDRIPELMSVSPFTSYERFNWASFHEADHFGDPSLSLRERLARDAAARGLRLPGGKVFLLTHLRYVGWCFNPVSFFYCYEESGRLGVVLAEVNNTFGGSHNYWLEPSDPALPSGAFHASATKAFYVSPFMQADIRYAFRFTPPGERLVAHMRLAPSRTPEDGNCFDATLSLQRRSWNRREIVSALVRHPLMTASVVGAIHWEALKLWWKGVPLVARPSGNGVYPAHRAREGAPAMRAQ